MKKLYFLICLCSFLFATPSFAGDTARVLFIGNSYTYVNDLPEVLRSIAATNGDVLIKNSSAPGGYTFQQHCTDNTTLSLIAQGNWDYVVLQEQSQLPSFPDNQVAADVYPYAKRLDSLVHAYNSCAKTIFYMTWGKKNGDAANCAFFPPICTYSGCDSMLRLRYTIMADDNNALLCPAGWVWNNIRSQYPGINLYDVDESHPTPSGTFATACSFYSLIFHKNPVSNSYNFSLNATDAANIKQVAKLHVYDSLSYWSRFVTPTDAAFTKAVSGMVVNFANTSQSASSYLWLFGDGGQSTAVSPSHTYAAIGTYTAKLIATNCNVKDTATQLVNIIGVNGIESISNDAGISIYPNPATESITITAPFRVETIQLKDITGRLVRNYNNRNGIPQIDGLATLEAGVYVLCINGKYYQQLIKN